MSNLEDKLMNILTDKEVKALNFSNDGNKNSLNDGAGLRIVVKHDNTKVWKFIYTFQGMRKDDYYSQLPGQWGQIWFQAGSKNNVLNNVFFCFIDE